MIRYIVISIISGVLFGIIDGFINANPIAIKLFSIYSPIARTGVNYIAGMIIDLVYGFVMAYLFIMLYKALPTDNGIIKGISYGLIMWFFRVFMYGISQWMILEMDLKVLFYILITGLFEMLVLGVLYGISLKDRIFYK